MNRKGFTVIELLIVAAIFSLVITGLTIAFIQQQRQFHLAEEDIDIDQTGRTAINFVASQVRNATARLGKSFSVGFVNGGSLPTGCAAANTTNSGTINSPPDCLTVYTWDITRGEDSTQPANPLAPRFPSTPGVISIVSPGPPLVLQLPSDWFPSGKSPLVSANDLLGFRSRINLCSPDSTVNCGTTPQKCSECSAILRVSSVNSGTMQATIADNVSSIVQYNFPVSSFSSMTNFLNGVAVNGVNYGFIPSIVPLSNEMVIVQAQMLTVDKNARQLEIVQNATGAPQPVVGGSDAPGIVDLQFVFDLMDADGGTTKVGVPLDKANRKFPDFSDPSLLGRQKDIIAVEIYLLVRSRVKAPLIQGVNIPVQTIPAIGDVLQRTTSLTSDTVPNPGAGYVYRLFSTTVYMRNMSRDDFR